MTTLRAGLVQLTASDDPAANLPDTERLIRAAATDGAALVLTPEVTNIVSFSRTRRNQVLTEEAEDQTLARLREVAAELRLWLLIGSLALKSGDPDGRFLNRSLLVGPEGEVRARYDKIHMFDAVPDPERGEAYRESRGTKPGATARLAAAPWGKLGMTVCYDLRFPELFLRLARAGASVIAVPSAFSPTTGAAHWETLLRARAIETGCFVLAPAQTGAHTVGRGPERATYGHSMVVAPWGEVRLDGGDEPGAFVVDLDLDEVEAARRRVGGLLGARVFHGP